MIDRTRNYLVLNYNSSPVVIKTRYESMVIPGGSRTAPSSLPLSVDEILQVNNEAPFFKCGLLFFEPEFQEDLYEECRIKNWRAILTDEQIEDIILHPTIEGLQKILSIETEIYFERCYGVYIGLMNANFPIPNNVSKIMKIRRTEFRHRKTKTEIELTPKDVATPVAAEEFEKTKAQVDKLLNLVAEMKKQNEELAKALKAKNDAPAESTPPKTRKTTSKPKEV